MPTLTVCRESRDTPRSRACHPVPVVIPCPGSDRRPSTRGRAAPRRGSGSGCRRCRSRRLRGRRPGSAAGRRHARRRSREARATTVDVSQRGSAVAGRKGLPKMSPDDRRQAGRRAYLHGDRPTRPAVGPQDDHPGALTQDRAKPTRWNEDCRFGRTRHPDGTCRTARLLWTLNSSSVGLAVGITLGHLHRRPVSLVGQFRPDRPERPRPAASRAFRSLASAPQELQHRRRVGAGQPLGFGHGVIPFAPLLSYSSSRSHVGVGTGGGDAPRRGSNEPLSFRFVLEAPRSVKARHAERAKKRSHAERGNEEPRPVRLHPFHCFRYNPGRRWRVRPLMLEVADARGVVLRACQPLARRADPARRRARPGARRGRPRRPRLAAVHQVPHGRVRRPRRRRVEPAAHRRRRGG